MTKSHLRYNSIYRNVYIGRIKKKGKHCKGYRYTCGFGNLKFKELFSCNIYLKYNYREIYMSPKCYCLL